MEISLDFIFNFIIKDNSKVSIEKISSIDGCGNHKRSPGEKNGAIFIFSHKQDYMNFEKTGSQQKCLIANKSLNAHLPSFKEIKFRHFQILNETHTTTVKNIIMLK